MRRDAEATLLPRHWEWLDGQPGTASQTLRRLIDEARRQDDGHTVAQRRVEAAYRFLTTVAGDRPAYEDALRALFAGDRERFRAITAAWPGDVADHASRLAWPPA
jgi:uncharacterized protein